MNLKEYMLVILSEVIAISMFIMSIITKNIVSIVISCILLIIFTFFFLSIILIDDFLKDRKVKKIYNEVKNKTDINWTDELIILVYQKKIKEHFKNFVKKNKIKNIENLNITILSKNKFFIFYAYKSFYIKMLIKNDDLYYDIDSPEKYDHLSETKEIEKGDCFSSCFENCNSIENFYQVLIEKINQLKLTIKSFESSVTIDNVFNGKLLDNLKRFNIYIKLEGYIVFILSLLILIFWSYLSYLTVVDEQFRGGVSIYTISIINLIIISLLLAAVIYSINYIILDINMKNDFKNKRLKVINKKPYRVRIIRDQKTRYSNCRTIRFIKLYYKDFNLLIPFYKAVSLHYKINIKECYEALLEIECELKYLEKSGVVIRGANKYINTCIDYLV